PGRVAIDVVHLVEVDAVGLHALERRLAGAHDVERREARLVGPVAHAAVNLGGEHDLVAPAAALREPAADDLLGPALSFLPAVDVRRVEEVDTELEGPVHDALRILLAGLRAEIHRSQAQARHLEPGASESGDLHAP